MAFAAQGGEDVMSEINVTPLVDVMLVLLIIFMITAPLMTHKVTVKLPLATLEEKVVVKTPPVTLAIKSNGELYWNDERVSVSQLEAKLAVTVQRTPQPELQIRADRDTEYQIVASVMGDAKNAGMVKVGFITQAQGGKE